MWSGSIVRSITMIVRPVGQGVRGIAYVCGACFGGGLNVQSEILQIVVARRSELAHVGHLWMKTKPGRYAKVSARYRSFADQVMAHHADLHDVIIVGSPAQNTVEGFGIWENAAEAATLEDTEDFASFLADVESDLAQPIQRSDLELLYRLRPRP
jgi:hypothetical protein